MVHVGLQFFLLHLLGEQFSELAQILSAKMFDFRRHILELRLLILTVLDILAADFEHVQYLEYHVRDFLLHVLDDFGLARGYLGLGMLEQRSDRAIVALILVLAKVLEQLMDLASRILPDNGVDRLALTVGLDGWADL